MHKQYAINDIRLKKCFLKFFVVRTFVILRDCWKFKLEDCAFAACFYSQNKPF